MTDFPNLLPELAAAVTLFDPDVSDVAAARAASDAAGDAAIAALSYDGVDVRVIAVPGWRGAPDVPVRMLTPVGARSDQAFDGSPTLNRTTGELLWSYYLGPEYTGPEDPNVSAYAAPARADDLSGLPPTYIAAMELDPVRDQGIDYAVRLLRAGVRVELHSHAGTFHGSAEFAPEAASSWRIRAGIIDALGRGLGVGSPSTSPATGVAAPAG